MVVCPMCSLTLAPVVEYSRINAQLTQDRSQCTCWQVATTVARNHSELFIRWIPPDFVGSRSLAHKLAVQIGVVYELAFGTS